MAVDTPARIVVIGAGPIGLETALYARFLGYDVALYERGRVADHVQRWGVVKMSTPWRMNVTSLGLAALRAQDTLWKPPPGDTLLTGPEWAAQYLVPLSQSDLLADNLYERTEVLTIARQETLPGELDDEDEDDEPSFVVRVRDAAGRERVDTADVVIDASGVDEPLPERVEPGLAHTTAEMKEIHPESLNGPAAVQGDGPDHYILGAKSYAGRADFVVSIGHQQIRDLFAIIGDRADLDLYKSMARAEM